MDAKQQSTMKTSPFGLGDIERREGKRYKVYLDSRGYATIGVGHLLTMTYDPTLTWSEEQIASTLAQDLGKIEDLLNEYIDVPITQPQFDSLVSLAFNIGIGAFSVSTLLRVLNKGEYKLAAEEFPRWSKQPELLSRRMEERAVFLYGTL